MELWKGAPVAASMKEKSISEIEQLQASGVVPTLGVIRVGQKDDDLAYERGIQKRFESVGAKVVIKELPKEVSQKELEKTLVELNEDPTIHGVLIFNPLPKQIDMKALRSLIAPEKDIDCFGWTNLAYVFANDERAYPPCTAQAVIETLDYYGVDVTGKKVTVIGRSLVVGRPVAALLMHRNATVTVCHTKTINTPAEANQGDILVVCAREPRLVKKEYMHDDQIVIDVGIHADGDSLCGDVDERDLPELKAFTPVPGGVGSVTTAVLLKHTIQCAKRFVKNHNNIHFV